MQKDKVVFLVIVSVLVGFIIGAYAGIRFATKEHAHNTGVETAPDSPANPKAPSGEEINRLESALKGDPNNLRILVALGNSYFDTRQHRRAVDIYARALKIEPKNGDVRTDMAIMYRSLKDYDRAAKELRQAAADNPGHVNSRYNLGIVLLNDKKDVKGAVEAWEDCLRAGATGEQAEMIRQKLQELKELVK